MNRIAQWFADRKARKAWRDLERLRQLKAKRERQTVKQVAQQMRIECGLLPHRAFK